MPVTCFTNCLCAHFAASSVYNTVVLESLLQSKTFSRSDQLKRFLRYVCEKEIAGKADEINEYSIAIKALGRGRDYSPSDDSSERTRAHALRQKPHEYYETEDLSPGVKVDIAKGAYTPQFLSQHASPTPPAPEAASQRTALPPEPAQKQISRLKPFLTGCVVTSLLLGTVLLLRGTVSSSPRIDPILREACGPMLNPGTVVQVYIATPPAMLRHSYRDEHVPAFPFFLPTPKEVSSWYDSLRMMDGGGKLYMHTTQDVFLFGDSLGAISAVQLLSKGGAVPKPVPESDMGAFALRGSNVIFIGSPNYSPLAGRFLLNTPFSVRYDPVRRREVVSDNPPQGTSARIFRPSSDEHGMPTKAYGLLTVIPSETHGEDGARTVIFSGITSAGPQAALEFFRSPEDLRALKAKLRHEGFYTFPAAYQVVVRCGLDHNLALSWEYATHVVLKPSFLHQ